MCVNTTEEENERLKQALELAEARVERASWYLPWIKNWKPSNDNSKKSFVSCGNSSKPEPRTT